MLHVLLLQVTHLIRLCCVQLHLCGSSCKHTDVCLTCVLHTVATLLNGSGSACDLLLQQLHGREWGVATWGDDVYDR